MAIAIEFCILLGRQNPAAGRGLPATSAAAAARRLRSSHADWPRSRRQPSSCHRGSAALSAGSAGHFSWLPHLLGAPAATSGHCGAFCARLGVALLYPLTLALAMGAAGTRADTASARAALAGTLGHPGHSGVARWPSR